MMNSRLLTLITIALWLPAACAPSGAPTVADHDSAALAALGVADLFTADDGTVVLLDERGLPIGEASVHLPRVEVQLDGALGLIRRVETDALVRCDDMADAAVVDDPAALEQWIAASDLSARCVTALQVARVISGIDRLHDPSCRVETVDGEEKLDCGTHADAIEFGTAQSALLSSGSGCGECAGDGWGYCDPSCWSCDGGSSCGDNDIGGSGGGGGSAPACGLFNWTRWFVEWNGVTTEDACATARARGTQACWQDSGSLCIANVGRVVTVFSSPPDCDGPGNCSCTMQVECLFSSRY